MAGGTTKPGKHHARNQLRRDKKRALIAEAKIFLVRVKELQAQLKLKEEKNDELHGI